MYFYLVPAGGWNDILGTIERVFDYCARWNRILLINGKGTHYKVNFAEYFHIQHPNVICDTETINEIIKGKTCTKITELPTSDVDDSILKMDYGRVKGSSLQYKMLKTFVFSEHVKAECKRRYELLTKPYVCIQVRNTDYT